MEESGTRRARRTMMSNYGLKTYTPEQTKEQWRESIRGENRLRDSHLITSNCSKALSEAWKINFSRHLSTDAIMNYFNTNKKGSGTLAAHPNSKFSGVPPGFDSDSDSDSDNDNDSSSDIDSDIDKDGDSDSDCGSNGDSHDRVSNYDRTFHVKTGYCSKLHRDDREHTRGLNVSAEELTKAVPVLSSSLYGHRPPLEIPSRRHVRVATVKRDFYRHSGTNIPLF